MTLLIKSQWARIAQIRGNMYAQADIIEGLRAKFAASQQRERAAVDESLIDFIVEHDTDILLAIETKDRAYLETVLKQWRGHQEAGEECSNDK